jgi:hypothetical protein
MFGAFNIMAEVLFADPETFARQPATVLEKHWPGVGALGFDLEALIWGSIIWRSSRAADELGWRPRYGFGEFLDAHRRGDRTHHPYSTAQQWGLDRGPGPNDHGCGGA